MDTIRRDTIAIGTSAGGVEALPRLLGQLGRDLDATVLIVQHLASQREPYLVEILRRASALPVDWADQGARADLGHVYVAPPDSHLLVHDGHLRLVGGPRENHARPSIDRLFRSVAAERGARVIGVLLTGMLDDGVAGLRAIRAAGGLAIAQDPIDAQYPELPARAIAAGAPDRVLVLDAIGPMLNQALREPVDSLPVPDAVARESALDAAPPDDPDAMRPLGLQSPISCPECRGPLWEIGDEHHRRYRCYLGHASTARDLLEQGTQDIESALWSAVRALHERAMTYQQLAHDASRAGRHPQAAKAYEVRAKEARDQAEIARRFMLDVTRPR